MQRVFVIVGFILLCMAAGGDVFGQVSVRRSRGTHFLVDLNVGTAIYPQVHPGSNSALAFGTNFGVGGRLAGSPLRAYFTLDYIYSPFFFSESEQSLSGLEGMVHTVILGMRALLPIFGGFRGYGDFGLGRSFASTQIQDGRGATYDYRDAAFGTVMAALGLQFRFDRNFSFGGKMEALFFGKGAELIDLDQGRIDSWRWLVNATVHF
ncbi:MAG: hypothetical protein D6812_11100 [Deltaproteobacteria bacterium]|nr:MAG: hypothetical protein D6812_11100 [Deltaproteobacteria bacterium]